MLGRPLVAEKDCKTSSFRRTIRDIFGKASASVSTLRWGKLISSQIRQLRAWVSTASWGPQFWAKRSSVLYHRSEPS